MKKHYLWIGLLGFGIVSGIVGSQLNSVGLEVLFAMLAIVSIIGGMAALGVWIAEHWEHWK